MCFMTPEPAAPPSVPAAPATPVRGQEENRAAVANELDLLRKRKGTGATVLTGGLGDSGYGANAAKATALGQ